MRLLLTVMPLLFAAAVHAQTTPVGLWKTFDDDSGKPSSLVRIVSAQGMLEGRIEKLLDPDEAPNPLCQACTDSRHNQPVLGMTILRNVRHNDGHPGQWDGGDILDPDNGKLYRVVLKPAPDGRWLELRAYLGTPLFGRSQKWQRVD